LERLEEYRRRYGFKLYAYVLMSNHVHMLLETGQAPLSRIMQGLQLRYTG
jgi:REP element-mobilizing transposase RayT